MEKNKKFIKSRTANKNSDKIRKIKININNRKKENSLNNKATNRKIIVIYPNLKQLKIRLKDLFLKRQ